MGRGSLLLLTIFAVASATVEQSMSRPVSPSITVASHPTKWNGKPEAPTNANSVSFTFASYPVIWSGKPEAPTNADSALFTVASYPVKWDGKLKAPTNANYAPFTVASYPVKWNEKSEAPSKADSAPFTVASYPVKWNRKPEAPSNADSTPFTDASYPVKWNGNPEAPTNVDSAPFTVASYPPEAPTNVDSAPFTVASYPPEAPTAAATHHGLHVKHGMLFLRKNLYPGAALPQGTKLAGDESTMLMSFASRRDAEAIPFSFKELERILQTFRILPGSTRAEQVVSTLRTCEGSSTDPHTCATSGEAEADFAAEALGTKNPRRVVTLLHGTDEPAAYTVATRGVSSVGGGALVACHPMDYPYVVRYCHRPAMVEALRIQLNGVDGEKVTMAATAVAICHKNTTTWDSRYFDMLNATRGEEICHYMPQNYVTWTKMD